MTATGTRTVWRNWAGQQWCAPERIEHPRDESELAAAVARAVKGGLKVRAVGSGHSFTDTCCTDGVLVDLSNMGRVLAVDNTTRVVRVQAGIELHQLALELAAHGLALENQGDIDTQSLAGALATATHGTGARFRNLAANVLGARLVTAAGEVIAIDAASDPETLLAARVSLGALGIISEYTLRTVPAFRIHRTDRPVLFSSAMRDLDQLVDGHDHFELFAFPHADTVLMLTSIRTDEQPRPASKWSERKDDFLSNEVLGFAIRSGRRFPAAIPAISRMITRVLSTEEYLDHSYKIYAHDRRVRFTEMEYAIPRAAGREALERVMALITRRRIPVNFPIEMRFAAGDDALLSTAHARETAYIAVHQYPGMEYESYFRAVEKIMDEYDGRPHWGKRHYQTDVTLAGRYPGWERFQAVRARLDPSGVFTNDYIARVLGPTT